MQDDPSVTQSVTREYGGALMDTTTADLSDTLQALPPRLQAELLRHLRCSDEARRGAGTVSLRSGDGGVGGVAG